MLGESESGGRVELLRSLLDRLGSGGVTLAEAKALRGEVSSLLGHPNGVDRNVPPARRSGPAGQCPTLAEGAVDRLRNLGHSLFVTAC